MGFGDFTSGEWENCGDGTIMATSGEGVRTLIGYVPYDKENGTGEANANLMATAPKLLALAEGALGELEWLQEKFHDDIPVTVGRIITDLKFIINQAVGK